ncbi:ABC transporter ATP-binding protein [Bordetella avium]|uniref:ATP-binding cassette domain-containing protein n=1 Tax=Bordetella avium TaxID=521 RepID=UPI0005A553A6|nr:ABC transporter ATP-binding protein [Bordetella avium]RIQ52056.1 hypothetical protein D0843_09300 [Bordetella avium]
MKEKQRCIGTRLSNTIDSLVSRNAFSASYNYIAHLHGFASFSLNSVLSLAVIIYLLPSGIWQGYLISVAACAGVIAAFGPLVARLSRKSQVNLADYGHALGGLWDNVVNRYNLGNWKAQTAAIGAQYYRSQTALEWVKQISNCLLGIVTLIPSAYLIYRMVTAPAIEPALVAATLVNLTRIFHILNSLAALLYQILEFGSADAAFKLLLDSAVSAPSSNTARIKHIQINRQAVSDPWFAAEEIRTLKQGRFTARGENGAGKTTFLLHLKASDPDNVFYLQPSSEKMVWRNVQDSLSTGQRMMRVLVEIGKMDGIKVLALDEWDANLDQKNKRLVDDYLNELAKEKVIVEVRH